MRFFRLALFAGLSLMIMTACGSSNDNKTTSQPAAVTSCAAGQTFNPSTNTCVSTMNPQNGGYSPNTPYPGQYPNTQCGPGQVYSQQYLTCLTQASCPPGFAMYNGSCTSVTNQNQGQYPQNCPTNTFATQYGCQSPGQCAYGSVYYQGQCQYGNYFNYGAGFGFHFYL